MLSRRSIRVLVALACSLLAIGWAAQSRAAETPIPARQWLGQEGKPKALEHREFLAKNQLGSQRISLKFPGTLASVVEAGEQHTTRLSIPNAGLSAEAGQPELPVWRRLLTVDPHTAFFCKTVVTSQRVFDLAAEGLSPRLIPAHRPIPKVPGAVEAAAVATESGADALDEEVEVARLLDLGIARGQRVLLLEVFPVAYNAKQGSVILREGIEVEVVTENAQGLAKAPVDLSPLGASGKRLLIIVPDSLAPVLDGFSAHKRGRGWSVDTAVTSVTGTNAASIQSFIRARYASEATRPTHLLLAGDTDTIAAWPGKGAYLPDTDLYYACMDGTNDWLQDMAYGRFPARTVAQLSNMVTRTLYYETNVAPQTSFVSRAAFITSEENYLLTEGTHNYVIARHLDPRAYASQRLYRHTYAATTSQITNAVNAGCGLVAYSGHGSGVSWLDPAVTVSSVQGVTNGFMCPLVMSFACDTGSYRSYDECFAEAWLRRGGNAGAVAMLASSQDTYWEEDDMFEKCVFAAVFEDNALMLGDAVEDAKERYLAFYGSGSETLQYFEQYNLFGDPTLALMVFNGGPTLNAPLFLPDGSFQFTMSGITGLTYAVQTSTNLLSWATLTNFIATNATMNFRDPAATNDTQRFYRAVVP